MEVAVCAQGRDPGSLLDPRFGRAAQFVVWDDTAGAWSVLDNKQNLEAAQGAGIQSAATVVNAGCSALVCSHCGPKAFAVLAKAGVEVYKADAGTVADVVQALKKGGLARMATADVEGHW